MTWIKSKYDSKIFHEHHVLLYHAWLQDDLAMLISNWKLLDNLCNEYSKGICLDIESHPQPGTTSRFYRWTICQLLCKLS